MIGVIINMNDKINQQQYSKGFNYISQTIESDFMRWDYVPLNKINDFLSQI